MLKRNGERTVVVPPPAQQKLTRGEQDAYNEAIEAIEGELEALQHVKESVKGMFEDPVIFTIPRGPDANGVIEIPNTPTDRWQICSSLLKFRNSQVLLCDRKLKGAKEFAVIERFNPESPYAQAVGEAEVLLAGDDPVVLVQEYAARAEHSLQFMASNLVSKAHHIVWARYASTSPARVVSLISARCAEAASLSKVAEERAEHSRHVQPPRENASRDRIARSVV